MLLVMDSFHGIVKAEEFDFDFDIAGASAEGAPSSPWAAGAPELPRPMEGLREAGPPPFLTKTYDIVDDSSTDTVISWGFAGKSFVVWDANAFATVILPRCFKHSNFSSFVRQLNTYGFRKVDPDRWEFANEGFLRGQRELLKTIKRRRPPSSSSVQQAQGQAACLEVGQFGREGEVHRLQRDKGILLMEVVKLRQEQQATRAQMQAMKERITVAEQKQQQMTVFLAHAMKNPGFLRMLVDRQGLGGCWRELEDALSKKRRRPIEYLPRHGESSSSSVGSAASGHYVPGIPIGVDGVSEVTDDESLREESGAGGGEDTENFWVELLSLGLEEKRREGGGGEEEGSSADVDDDVDVLVQSIYDLNPNPSSPSPK
ncbi:heat stress transcription factor A-2a-like [Phragmites australis]|uniref:heat stress transcription factor A-2a-like n=1 Tax=Phragmites australis TaxID=29695 RepID=UPI002D77F58E|nr:heat stress transcription factor A-2a-like [Phragmites australis]